MDRIPKMTTRLEIREAFERAHAALGDAAKRERVERYRLEKTVAFIERYAGGIRGKRVLELGSSLGVNLLAAKNLGASRAVGLDYYVFPEVGENDFFVEPESFASLKRAWESGGIEVIKHDLAQPLPFPDGSFDLVVCNAVIEHLHGIHKALFLEAFRVLVPGGSFAFTTPNLASLLKRLRFLIGRSPNWDITDYFEQGTGFTGHVREFTVAECGGMLRKSGFEVTRVEAKPGYFKWRWLRMPRKWHMFFLQAVSRPFRTLGDLVFAIGKKPTV